MKILLANPPAYLFNPNRHFIQAGSRWSYTLPIPKGSLAKSHYLPYPFFLGYSSSLLKKEFPDHEIKVIDACAFDFDEKAFINYVKHFSPDVLVVEIPTISFPLMAKVLETIKTEIGCLIVVAGPHVTPLYEDVMKQYPFIDYCLIGEYEITLKELIKRIIKNSSKDEIAGLAFRKKGSVSFSGRRELLKNLDDLPFPDRDDLPVKFYHDMEVCGNPLGIMISSRGCPFSCNFCIERQVIYSSSMYRKRTPEKVVEEMSLLKEQYKVKQIYFDDQTITVDRTHIKSICEEILSSGLDLPWACMGDVNLDYETLKIMKKAGCVGIKFGVETIDENSLQNIKKLFIRKEKIENFVKNCKSLGFYTGATFSIGLLGDTRKGILTTLKFAKGLDTDNAQVSICTPFPGTPFFQFVKSNGYLLTEDWTKFDGNSNSVVSYPNLTKDEIEYLRNFFVKVYRKNKIFRDMIVPRRIAKTMEQLTLGGKFKDVFSRWLKL
jgi:radical SAM superfamily enzyme YgiQ (UPF0313 family)